MNCSETNVSSSNMSSNGITIKGLSYSYTRASQPALSNINLSIRRGTIFGLLGPNGAGKTTLISLLTGVIRVPSDVSIDVMGLDLPGEQNKISSISALVPQDYAFYPTLSARENLQHFSQLNGISKKNTKTRIDYCVDVCGLQSVLNQRASEFSGGVKRRLNLAIGLLNEPQVLYLDEPTVGIDAQSRNFILQAITELKRKGITVVYTSHYMDEVQAICDDIAIIDHGRVVASDSINNLIEHSVNTQLFVDIDTPLPNKLQAALRGQLVAETRLSVAAAPDTQELITLLSLLSSEGVNVTGICSAANKLEQVYLSLTRQELRD